jgi:hypothetical protein
VKGGFQFIELAQKKCTKPNNVEYSTGRSTVLLTYIHWRCLSLSLKYLSPLSLSLISPLPSPSLSLSHSLFGKLAIYACLFGDYYFEDGQLAYHFSGCASPAVDMAIVVSLGISHFCLVLTHTVLVHMQHAPTHTQVSSRLAPLSCKVSL